MIINKAQFVTETFWLFALNKSNFFFILLEEISEPSIAKGLWKLSASDHWCTVKPVYFSAPAFSGT